jgi:hypothetical protein
MQPRFVRRSNRILAAVMKPASKLFSVDVFTRRNVCRLATDNGSTLGGVVTWIVYTPVFRRFGAKKSLLKERRL